MSGKRAAGWRWLIAGAVVISGGLAAGCASGGGRQRAQPIPTAPVLRLTQQVGGTHYRTLVREDAWLQTFGTELLILEPRSARVLHTLRLGRIGETGAATDMIVHDDRLYAVLDADAVVELNLSDPRRPRIVEKRDAAELGIAPKRLSVAGGEVYVSGVGGVVRWSDNWRVFRHQADAGRVVMSDEGLVTCIGRRIYRLDDGRFVGSASDLMPALGLAVDDDDFNPERLIVFSRQSEQGALVGLMGPDLRELDSRNLTLAIPGIVRSVRIFDGLLWVVTDEEISSYGFEDARLARRATIDVLGARDVARVDEQHLAVAGSFGRALYRRSATERGPADTFFQVHREPSRLTKAKSDGRHVLAGSEEGSWLYLIGSRVDLSREAIDRGGAPAPPTTQASALGARARISEDGRTLAITTESGVFEHMEADGARMYCVTAVNGEFWVGHEYGITILRAAPPADAKAARPSAADTFNPIAGTLRLDGPVRYLFPLRLGQGVAFVSEYGGFGTAEWIDEPIETHARR